MDSDDKNKYFVICNYSSRYPHEAIFIRTNYLKENFNEDFMALLKFTNCSVNDNTVPCSNIIECIFENNTHFNGFRCVGYLINDQYDDTKETSDIINRWMQYITHGFSDYSDTKHIDDNYLNDISNSDTQYTDDDCIVNPMNDDYFSYYINDDNLYLSPSDLCQKLLSMTEYNGRKFEIEQCIIISDKPHNYQPRFILEFFVLSKKWLSREEIINIMLKDKNIVECIPASKGNIFQGFGYVQISSLEYLKELRGKKFSVGDIKIEFD